MWCVTSPSWSTAYLRIRNPPDTFAPSELRAVLAHIDGDRYGIAWQLALTGLRRGEVAGLGWSDIDLTGRTLQISSTRLRFGKHLVEDTPKSRASRRTLPIPDHLAAALRAARAIQAADRLALGEEYEASGYVVVDECGAESARAYITVGADAQGRRGPSHSVARRPAHLRDADALARCADRNDFRLARARFEGLHDGHLCALTARGADACRAELQQRRGSVATFLRTAARQAWRLQISRGVHRRHHLPADRITDRVPLRTTPLTRMISSVLACPCAASFARVVTKRDNSGALKSEARDQNSL
ncbi:MAG: hypothetical protein JWP83_1943 [Mycobacterium sp.]|nr:hypothetical protein [Mycobacterium sp.]